MSSPVRRPGGSHRFPAAAILVVQLLAVPAAHAQFQLPAGFEDQLVCGGISWAVGLELLPDGRILVTELKSGQLRLIVNGTLQPVPLVTVDSLVSSTGERGFFGVAADPGWPARPYLYVHYTHQRGDVRIARYNVTGDVAFTGDGTLAVDPASRYDILVDVPDASPYHNGGTIRFGTDGMMYVSIGDDFNDCEAQRLDGLNGRILRLDVSGLPDGGGGPPDRSAITPPDNPFPPGPNGNAGLTWAYGLRNPFRFQVDPVTDYLYVADVGSYAWEEVDEVTSGGLNFGWPLREGNAINSPSCAGVIDSGFTHPIVAVDRAAWPSSAICAVALYRNPASSPVAFGDYYEGDLFYADIQVGWIRRLRKFGGTWAPATPVAGQPTVENWGDGSPLVTDFLQGPDGAIYYARSIYGQVRRIVRTNTVGVGEAAAGGIEFHAPQPSPAGPDAVTLRYALDREARVTLAIYDVAGRRVRTLVDGVMPPGKTHEARWDGTDAGGAARVPGVYFARLEAGGHTLVKRITWLR